MYHRVGAAAYKADIQPTLDLMEHLGHPERMFRSIHITGTNGKGSVSHLLASILMQSGLRVGLYTSPHLVDFRERIRINGEMIEQSFVTGFVEAHRDTLDRLKLSFFEMTVGLAFHHFAQQQVDIAVVEVGMGGRLDSTNVILPLLSVITNIGFDHTQFLGDTLGQIAVEKAGIIKPGTPVVVGETHPETEPVFRHIADTHKAPITFADQHYSLKETCGNPSIDVGAPFLAADIYCDGSPRYTGIQSPLAGAYQRKNLLTLAAAIDQLRPQLGNHSVTCQHVLDGIRRVVSDTGLHGRWETIGHHPRIILETAHNADGIRSMLQQLSAMHYRRLHLIYGCVGDKDFRSILSLLPTDAIRYYTQPSVPRRLPVEELTHAAAAAGFPGSLHTDVHEAIEAARAAADPDDLILVTGSIFLVADALATD